MIAIFKYLKTIGGKKRQIGLSLFIVLLLTGSAFAAPTVTLPSQTALPNSGTTEIDATFSFTLDPGSLPPGYNTGDWGSIVYSFVVDTSKVDLVFRSTINNSQLLASSVNSNFILSPYIKAGNGLSGLVAGSIEPVPGNPSLKKIILLITNQSNSNFGDSPNLWLTGNAANRGPIRFRINNTAIRNSCGHYSLEPVVSECKVQIYNMLGGGSQAFTLNTQGGEFSTLIPVFPTLEAVSVDNASLLCDQVGTGTVSLGCAAPLGGALILLASSNPLAASVPVSVFIPQGATSATFPVDANSVSGRTPVTITATYGLNTRSVEVTVNPIASVTVNPDFASCGSGSAGTITLACPAPLGGLTAKLSSDNPSAMVPTSIIIPAGQSSAQFPISTTSTAEGSVATITVNIGGDIKTATLNLLPVFLTGIAITPDSVEGGVSATGTITINCQAPPGGLRVDLTSSDPAATTPTFVIVPEGQNSASFLIQTSPVNAQKTALITASTSAGLVFSNLTIQAAPATLVSVSANPSVVSSGEPSAGTVTLSAPAPSGGATVTLSSNNAAVTVPPNVIVAENTSSQTFSITTSNVTQPQTATITATYGSQVRTTTLTVNPNTVTLTVNVKLEGWIGSATPLNTLPIEVIVDGGAPSTHFVLGSGNTGSFTLSLPPSGTHSVRLKPRGFLSETQNITTTGSNLSATFDGPSTAGMVAGDAVENNVIDDFDLAAVIFDFGRPQSGNNGFTDVNGDGIVNDFDLAIVIFGFGKVGS